MEYKKKDTIRKKEKEREETHTHIHIHTARMKDAFILNVILLKEKREKERRGHFNKRNDCKKIRWIACQITQVNLTRRR